MYSYVFIYIQVSEQYLGLEFNFSFFFCFALFFVVVVFFFSVLFWEFSKISGCETTSRSPGVNHVEAKPFKGHLCYKTITSQNVLYEAQVKNFFIL